jgi:hypothetical protein
VLAPWRGLSPVSWGIAAGRGVLDVALAVVACSLLNRCGRRDGRRLAEKRRASGANGGFFSTDCHPQQPFKECG